MLNVLLSRRIFLYHLLVIIHQRGDNLHTGKQIREAGGIEQHFQVADFALLIGGAHGLRKLFLLLCKRLFSRFQFRGLDINLILQARNILLHRRDLLLCQVDLLLQRVACRLYIIGLLGQFCDRLLHRRLLFLQRTELVAKRIRIRIILCSRCKRQAGGEHGKQHRDNQDARDHTRNQPDGFLFHHNGFRSFVSLPLDHTSINLRILVTEPPIPNSTPAPQYTPSTSQRTLSNGSSWKYGITPLTMLYSSV